jgi:CubicO group peptidase (beta-lactamase class C family)
MAAAQGVTPPVSVGRRRVIQLKSILEAGVAAGRAPGLAAAVITPGGTRWSACAGVRSVDDPAPMTLDTVFWIASCTKAITSVAALQLVERGLIDIDEPVGRWLPRLAEPRVLTGFDAAGAPVTRSAATPITLRRLLTHTSGFGYDFFSADLARCLEATGSTLLGAAGEPDIPLMFEPGEAWLYGIGIDWVGRLVEALTGEGLDAVVEARICAPLGMTDTTFFPGPAQAGRRAVVHQKLPDGGFAATAFAMPQAAHFMMGGGGLYSTVGDYLKFLAAILAGGAPILRPETCAMMLANHVGDLDAGALVSAQPLLSRDFTPSPGVTWRWGLAGLLNVDPVPGGRAAGALAWAGLANCYYWADPARGAAGVVMAQVLPFGDPGVLATFEAVERAVYA